MEKQEKRLFSEFQDVPTAKWEEQIMKDLKGADYAKKLNWKTDEGFTVKPYYRSEDLEQIAWLRALPADFPFVRGNAVSGNDWLVRQEITVTDIKQANEKALEILMKGVDSLGFELELDKKYSMDEIELLLKNVRADIAELNFYATKQHLELVGILEKLVIKYNRPLDAIKASVNYDPLARYARRGNWYVSEEADFSLAHQLIQASAKLPQLKVIGVNGHIFANSGATIVQEMAYTLALGSEYLSRLTDKGLFVGEITPKMKFNLAVGPNYFMEIAKLRAYRLLWAHIANAFGLNDANNGRMFVHATNTTHNMSLYDPYVNMLRTTTSSMSAILGGVDSLTVQPFNVPFEKPTDFAQRIARNQQLILKEESYFDRVADPAAGSYYVESLTQSLVEEAWKLFLSIQDEGGYVAALKKGTIQQQIAESTRKRDLNIATRRDSILGVNQYASTTERMKALLAAEVFEADDRTAANAEIETIKTYRAAQAFEQMRYETDMYSLQNQRPVVWMLTYGNLAMRKARAGFAANFFACAGYEIVDNIGFESVEKGIEAAKAAKPSVVVLCSSDEEYADHALKAYQALKNDAIVVLAGNPAETVELLKNAGMQHFIHMRSNVLETLIDFQKQLGIARQ